MADTITTSSRMLPERVLEQLQNLVGSEKKVILSVKGLEHGIEGTVASISRRKSGDNAKSYIGVNIRYWNLNPSIYKIGTSSIERIDVQDISGSKSSDAIKTIYEREDTS